LLSAYQRSGESRVNTFTKEMGMKLKDDLIRVVIEVDADSHEPLIEEILDDLRDRIILGKELPDSVTTKFYGSGEDIYGTEHGTACAEIIYDMAPDARLFFTQPRTEIELWDAINMSHWQHKTL